MKRSIVIWMMLGCLSTRADQPVKPTTEFRITGSVKQEMHVTLDDLKNYPMRKIGDIVLTNQRGEVKDTVRNLGGVALKDMLQKVELLADRPRILNEFYFTCVASDGYKVVFSWNEIFNTEVGNSIYIVLEKEGVKAPDFPERILLVSGNDLKKGRRYIKNLSEIRVYRTE
jgi:hypothetical protein